MRITVTDPGSATTDPASFRMETTLEINDFDLLLLQNFFAEFFDNKLTWIMDCDGCPYWENPICVACCKHSKNHQ